VRGGILIIALLAGMGLRGNAVAEDAPIRPDDLVARVQAFYDRTTDYKASFRQVVTTAHPARTFTRSGTVYFKRPGMMRWDYKVPDEVYYVSDGDVLWSYEVEEGVAYRLDLGGSELAYALRFLSGSARLKDDFTPAVGTPAASGRVPLALTPRTPQGNFKMVTLFVDPKTGETGETQVVDPQGNVSRVSFDGPSFKPLPRDGFTFKPPEGVRVQDVGPR